MNIDMKKNMLEIDIKEFKLDIHPKYGVRQYPK
jgi:hypothetical protein